MRTMGIRELKAGLSGALRAVQNGETILVTDRGHVVAELRRPDGGTFVESRTDRILVRLAADGELRVAERALTPYAASPLSLQPGAARALLDDDRDEL